MTGSTEEDEDEVADDYSQTSFSNNSEDENDSTDAEEHNISCDEDAPEMAL
jgi:hypothetical protein